MSPSRSPASCSSPSTRCSCSRTRRATKRSAASTPTASASGWYDARRARHARPLPQTRSDVDRPDLREHRRQRCAPARSSPRPATPARVSRSTRRAPRPTRGTVAVQPQRASCDWRGANGTASRCDANCPTTSLAATEGATDSEVLFGLVLDRIAAGATPTSAIASVVHDTCRSRPTRASTSC